MTAVQLIVPTVLTCCTISSAVWIDMPNLMYQLVYIVLLSPPTRTTRGDKYRKTRIEHALYPRVSLDTTPTHDTTVGDEIVPPYN